jgi:DNA-binding CsgD family transcriptional regulator
MPLRSDSSETRDVADRRNGAEDDDRTSALRHFGDVFGALDRLPLPVFAIASNGVIRWLNMAAEQVVGDRRGSRFTQLVAPESKGVVDEAFASKVIGSREATDYEAVLLTEDGSRVDVEICSVAVDGDAGIAGVFGAVELKHRDEPAPRVKAPELTPRQAEVLSYLTRGYTTAEMASAMGLSPETVRNHVRGVLQRLGVHSRLEAVTAARMRGIA